MSLTISNDYSRINLHTQEHSKDITQIHQAQFIWTVNATCRWIVAVGCVMSRSKTTSVMQYHCNKLILKPLRWGFASAGETKWCQIKDVVKLHMSCDLSTTVATTPPEQTKNSLCHTSSDDNHTNTFTKSANYIINALHWAKQRQEIMLWHK